MSTQFDAIVIGSGMTGGWAARELTRRGLKTLVLERGREIEHIKDYQGEHKGPWDYKFRGEIPPDEAKNDYFIQSKFGWCSDFNKQFWNNDRLNPYVYDEDKPFNWVHTDVLAGRSMVWGRQVYRWSDLDFEANKRDGHGIDWPIRYADIEPWYDYVENHIGISGEKLGLPYLPDGQFQKPMELNVVEKHVRRTIQDQFPGRDMTVGRVAILTEPHNGRGPCHYCGPCHRGCSVSAYFSALTVTLPDAKQTGNLTLRTDAVVEGLDVDPDSGRITGVRVIDAKDKSRETYSAKLVFLCASTIGSTQVLMNSASDAHPNGLANGSGVLGKYMMDHTFGTGITGIMHGFDDRTTYGFRPNGIYVPRFRNLDGQDDPGFLRGYGFQGGAVREGILQNAEQLPGFGPDFKKQLGGYGRWRMSYYGFGEILPYADNRMMLDPVKKDRFGIPQVRFDTHYHDNEKRMIDDMLVEGEAMLTAAGATDIVKWPGGMTMGSGVHEMGTARMGHDPSESVLNGWNQAHEVPNLFVTDGACMTSGSCVNPSITYMALTARAANYAADRLAEGAL